VDCKKILIFIYLWAGLLFIYGLRTVIKLKLLNHVQSCETLFSHVGGDNITVFWGVTQGSLVDRYERSWWISYPAIRIACIPWRWRQQKILLPTYQTTRHKILECSDFLQPKLQSPYSIYLCLRWNFKSCNARLQVLTAITVKITDLWDVTSCSFVRIYEHFGETCRLNLQGRRNQPRGENHKQYKAGRFAGWTNGNWSFVKQFFFSNWRRKNAKGRKKREKDGIKIIIHLQSPLMSSESPFLALLKT
jgi:hypothetical protein